MAIHRRNEFLQEIVSIVFRCIFVSIAVHRGKKTLKTETQTQIDPPISIGDVERRNL